MFPPEPEPWLLDLFQMSQASIASDDELLIFGKRRRRRSSMEVLTDQHFERTMLRTSPVLGAMSREADKIYPLVFDLMSLAPSERQKAVRRRPYKSLVLAGLLLEESRRAKRPERAEEVAQAAEWIAEQPWPKEPDRATGLRIEALMAQGEALRHQCNWENAELRFGSAFALLQQLPLDLDHIFLYKRLSRLREDQGRYQEAALLQLQAMHLQRLRFNNDRLSFDGMVRLAFLYLRQSDPARAMTMLTELFLDAQEETLFPMYRLEIDFGRAVCLAALGLAEPARDLLRQTLKPRRQIDERDKQLPLEWLECRISVHLGDLDHAIPRLEALRRLMLREGKLEEACLCSIDLALAYARQGTASKHFSTLLHGICRISGAAEEPWALGALWWLREALEQGQDPAAAARTAAEIVHRRERSIRRLAAEGAQAAVDKPGGQPPVAPGSSGMA